MALVSFLFAIPLILQPRSSFGASNTTGQTLLEKEKSIYLYFLDIRALKEPTFVTYMIANFSIFLGFYIPFFFIPLYAQVLLGTSQSTSYNFLAITHAGGVIGRLLPGLIASRFTKLGAVGTHALFGFCSATLVLAWTAVNDTPGFVVCCVLWGFFVGAHIAMPPSVTADLSPVTEVLGTRIGMVEAVTAPAVLIGGPIAGALIGPDGQTSKSSFTRAQLLAGVALLIGAVLILPVWRMLSKQSRAVALE